MPSMVKAARLSLLLMTAALTSACSSGHSVRATTGPISTAGQGSAVKPGPGGVVKIGNPYRVGDRWYYPADIKDYDETGIASWYGPKFHKQRTANGEIFDMNEVSAAHPILPMPSYVEVTNLNNGRQLLVRINDRGPFVKGRIIDLSRRAAQLLGFDQTGTAPVRVRRVYPDARGRITPSLPPTVVAQAQPHAPASAPASAPVSAPASAPVSAPQSATVTQTDVPPSPYQPPVYQAPVQTAEQVPPPAPEPLPQTGQGGIVYIQVAALSDSERADTLALNMRRFGASLVEPTGRGLYRVQIGPFDSPETAEIVLAKIRAAGYADAHVTLRPIS